MKYLLLLFIFFTSTYASVALAITDTNTTQLEHHKCLKKYFKTNQVIGINVRKNPLRPYYKKVSYELIWFEEKSLNPIAHDLLEIAQNDKIIANAMKKSFNIDTVEDLLFESKSR